ncbi:MAG: right-handed parallel beta-helix repeat-containing protein [Candidatus Latescibacteria bacterium]|nr:right-handed parallel beta-helix repeat-containing protein [Candidatus Latescibacterota bacterium]
MGTKVFSKSVHVNQKVDATFYVATDGNDKWSGKLAKPNAKKTDGPFATLVGARDAVRELKKEAREEGIKGPVTVMVRGGKYYFEKTFDLTEVDSGTQQAPITYTAYPGETPIISGGRKITDWEPYKGKILKCRIPEAKEGTLTFRQLFVDGKRQIRARYPNLDPKAERWNGKWAHSKADAAVLESSEPYIVWDEQGAFPRSWAKPSQGELFLMPSSPLWGDSCIIRIKSIDRDKKIIRLVHGTRDFDCNPMFFRNEQRGSDVCQFIVENILEELDQPGEWCLDSEEGVLYFWPSEDSIDNMEVVAPVVKCLIHLKEVSDVHISGFVFTETKGGEPSSHYSDVEGVGAMCPQMGWEYCGEAIYLNVCKNCYIDNCKIFNVGGNGIYLRNHNERNVIRGNEISYAGANGVVLAGSKHNIYQEMMHTISGTPHPIYNEITDNIIHHIGVYDTYTAGVFLGLSSWNRVVHNEIHDLPHHAINLGNSRYGRNYIEYNRIYRACQVNDDTGAINCWNEMPPEVESPGHVIRYNFISDTGKAGQITMGIYLDNWASQCIVQGNIIVNTAPNASGFAIFAKGRNNIIENNILINSGTVHIIFAAHYPEMATVLSKKYHGLHLPSQRAVFPTVSF